MEQIFKKLETLGVSLRPPCSMAALDQAKQKIQAIYAPLPLDYVEFLSKHNGFKGNDDIVIYYVTDPESTDPSVQKSGEMDLLTSNTEYHKLGLDEMYIVLGECDLGLFIYDAEEREFVLIDVEGFEEFDGYESFEDMLIEMIDPEYFDEDELLEMEEDDEDEE